MCIRDSDSFDFVDFAAENVPQEQQYWANTQFIVRKEKDVESLLDSFDYDLCRIAYRPSTDEIIFYKEAFDKVIKTKKFTFPNEASYDRARRFGRHLLACGVTIGKKGGAVRIPSNKAPKSPFYQKKIKNIPYEAYNIPV